MKVAAYIRVSTDEQAQEGYSIPAQRNRLEAYAISQGWEIVQYYVDEGISAKDMNRPELQRMIKGVKEGFFDCVLVYKLDRLTRSVLDLYQLLETFEKYNVKFKSATEVYDTTTAIGRLFITLVAALAQWERENLGERVRMGMQQKAKEGKWTVSIPPIGYNAINDSNLEINHQEASIVKEIFSLYLSGAGMWGIARSLNERGLHTKHGKTWSQNTISYILKNPIYKGTTRYNYRVNQEQYFEVDGFVPPIISEEEFNMVQQIIESKSNLHPRQASSKFIFSKVLKCARCGTTLIGKTSTSKRGNKKYVSYNYVCPNERKGLCTLLSINQNYFEQKFIQMIAKWDIKEEVAEDIENEISLSADYQEETIKHLQNELKEIEKRRSKWQYAWVGEMISDFDFKKRINEENEKEKMILKELEELTPRESPIEDNSHIIDILSDLRRNWENMDDQAKKQFILIAVNKIVVDKISKVKSPDSIEIVDFKLN
jgi:site-specific DNA recombinase